MNIEFDCDLTPDQWETLKALRSPTLTSLRLSRFVVDKLVALELVLLVVKLAITTIRREQLFMSAPLDNLTIFHDQDLISAANRR